MNNFKYDKAVVIGRFQPFHNGHVKMVSEALAESKTVYVLIGSALSFPNVRNPLTASERQSMITSWAVSTMDPKDSSRIVFRHIPDFLYNEEKWKTSIRTAIEETSGDKIGIYGYYKDKDSYWLKSFGWEHREVEPYLVSVPGDSESSYEINATEIRAELFAHKNGWDYKLRNRVPRSVISRLDTWMNGDTFWRLIYENDHWEREREKFRNYPYKGTLNCNTADAVVVCNNHLLVIERKYHPGQGSYALPGGHKNDNESFLDCAIRELLEEVRIKVPEKVIRGSIRNSMLFDHPLRSYMFCKPTVAQYIKLEPNNDGSLPRIAGGADDAADAFWMPLHQVVKYQDKFFDDHFQIVTAFTGI
ncbi:hydrolase [Pantoea phage Phynn]|nr:hydrolase [Pantoea phage Phynn]